MKSAGGAPGVGIPGLFGTAVEYTTFGGGEPGLVGVTRSCFDVHVWICCLLIGCSRGMTCVPSIFVKVERISSDCKGWLTESQWCAVTHEPPRLRDTHRVLVAG